MVVISEQNERKKSSAVFTVRLALAHDQAAWWSCSTIVINRVNRHTYTTCLKRTDVNKAAIICMFIVKNGSHDMYVKWFINGDQDTETPLS